VLRRCQDVPTNTRKTLGDIMKDADAQGKGKSKHLLDQKNVRTLGKTLGTSLLATLVIITIPLVKVLHKIGSIIT
jgi:hypothetical protein